MRFTNILKVFTFILILVPALVSAEHIVDDSENPVYLFTLASKSGTFEGDKLTLKGVPLAVYFADRPVRKAGHIGLEEFIGIWNSGKDTFRKDPPSAELAIYNESGIKHAVLILQSPELKGDELSFKVRVFHGYIPESFGHATLFIDSLGMKKSPSF